jgi:phage terminase large subunit GpA-like protein
MMSRREHWEPRTAPDGVKFITVSIDQQINRFVISVHGWGVGGEYWMLDRYNISESQRSGEDGKKLRVEPFKVLEDWAELKKVFTRDYSGMVPLKVWIDAGGMDKATENAYFFSKTIQNEPFFNVLMIGRGNTNKNANPYTVSDSKDKRMVGNLHLAGTTALKDEIHRMLARDEPGPGYCHFPDWEKIGQWFFDELNAEERRLDGWHKRSEKLKNEQLDLMAYARATWYALGANKIDWTNPPALFNRQLANAPKKSSFSDLAKRLNS